MYATSVMPHAASIKQSRSQVASAEYNHSLQQYKQLCISKGYMNNKGEWIDGGQALAAKDRDIYEAAAQSRAKYDRLNTIKQHEAYQASEAKRFEKERNSLVKQQKKALMRGLDTKITPEQAAQAKMDYDNYSKQLTDLDTQSKAVAEQSTDDWVSSNQKAELERQEAIDKQQSERNKKVKAINDKVNTGLQKAGNWIKDNGPGIAGQFIDSMSKGMNAARDKEAPESNTLRDRASEQERVAAEAEERKHIAEGEAKRNVQALAGNWTEMAANNAANIAAAAQGGDTGAGAAIARMQAAQGARDKEGAANLQRAQQRADTYEQIVSQRMKDEDAARASAAETQLQLHETQQKHKVAQERNRENDKLYDLGIKNLGAGPTTAEMDGNVIAPPPTPGNVMAQSGNRAGQAQSTDPQSDGRVQNAQYNKDGVAQGMRDALLKKANSGEMLTPAELEYAREHNIPTKDGKIEKLNAVTSAQDPNIIRRDKESAVDAMQLPSNIISLSDRKKIVDALMTLHGTYMDKREQKMMETLNHLKNDSRNTDATSQENAKRRRIEVLQMADSIIGGK